MTAANYHDPVVNNPGNKPSGRQQMENAIQAILSFFDRDPKKVWQWRDLIPRLVETTRLPQEMVIEAVMILMHDGKLGFAPDTSDIMSLRP